MTTGSLANTESEGRYSVFDISIREAMNQKRLEGIIEYRGGDETQPFQGDPHIEMYGELIDAMNYNEEAGKGGFKLYDKFKKVLNELAQELRDYCEEK